MEGMPEKFKAALDVFRTMLEKAGLREGVKVADDLLKELEEHHIASPTIEQTELNKCLSLLKEILTDVGGVTNCSKIHNACVAFRNAGGAYKLSINPQERAIANDASSEQTEPWKEKIARIILKHVKGSLNPIGIIGEDIAAKEIIETIEREYSLTRKQEVPEAVEFAEWIAQKHYYKDVHKEWYGCERGMTVLIAKTTAELFQLFKQRS